MPNYFTPFSLRVSEELLSKVKVIAVRNKRSANKEMEYALEQYVRDFEQRHGEISIDGDLS